MRKCDENPKYFPYFGFELTLKSGKGRSSNYERRVKLCRNFLSGETEKENFLSGETKKENFLSRETK